MSSYQCAYKYNPFIPFISILLKHDPVIYIVLYIYYFIYYYIILYKHIDIILLPSDELLKGSAGVVSDLEIEDQLEKVLTIFKFIADKDIFEDFYRKLLSKRLLGLILCI